MKLLELKDFDPSLSIEKGEGTLTVNGLSNVDRPRNGSFVFVKNAKFLQRIESALKKEQTVKVGAIIERKFYEAVDKSELQKIFSAIVTVADVAQAMTLISKPFYDEKISTTQNVLDGRQLGSVSIHPSARIAQGVFIGERVIIGEEVEILSGTVVMSDVTIGDFCKIYPNVVIYDSVRIGKRCRIHAGVVIGADGFGYNFKNGEHNKIWHIGGVHIEDDVEIGANTTIDRGTFADTRIGQGSKIDNLVQIGHNANIGRGVILCGQVGISGSATIGDFSVFAGRAGIGPDLSVGKACQIAAGSLVGRDWPDGSILGGHPSRPVNEWMRGLAYVRKNSARGND